MMETQVAAVFGYDADVELAPVPEPSAAGSEEAAAAAGSRRRGLTVQLSEVVSARLGRALASKAAVRRACMTLDVSLM